MTFDVLGIDLGTTNSVVATIDGTGALIVVPNAVGDLTTSSSVYFQGADVVVGAEARQAAALDPSNGVTLVKRQMGTEFPIHIADQVHTPESISGIILRQLVAAATSSAPRTVVTVPAYFGTAEREATFQASRIAGIEVLELLDEPVAAAIHYGLTDDVDRTILVYDLGGGTFDTTVLTVRRGKVTVVATDGHNRLGGADVDDRLLDVTLSRIQQNLAPDAYEEFIDDPRLVGALRMDVESAKKALSQSHTREVRVRTPAGTVSVTLNRDDLAESCGDLFSTTTEVIERVLAAARGKSVTSVDEVIMVGGSSRIPILRHLLGSLLGVVPRLVEPDLAVAKGAAIRAHQLAGTPEYAAWTGRRAQGSAMSASPTAVTPVAPRAVGVLVHDSFDPSGERQFVEHLIYANTALPVSVTRRYATILDDQPSVRLQIYEQAGTIASDDLGHNRLVVDGEFSGFGELPAGSVIELRLSVAIDGRISLTATERASRRQLVLQAFVTGVVDAEETEALASQVRALRVRG